MLLGSPVRGFAFEEHLVASRELLDGPVDVADVRAHRRLRQLFVTGNDGIDDGLVLTGEIGQIGTHVEIQIAYPVELHLLRQGHVPGPRIARDGSDAGVKLFVGEIERVVIVDLDGAVLPVHQSGQQLAAVVGDARRCGPRRGAFKRFADELGFPYLAEIDLGDEGADLRHDDDKPFL